MQQFKDEHQNTPAIMPHTRLEINGQDQGLGAVGSRKCPKNCRLALVSIALQLAKPHQLSCAARYCCAAAGLLLQQVVHQCAGLAGECPGLQSVRGGEAQRQQVTNPAWIPPAPVPLWGCLARTGLCTSGGRWASADCSNRLFLLQILVGVAVILLYLSIRPNERRKLNFSIAEIWHRANDMSPELIQVRLLSSNELFVGCVPAISNFQRFSSFQQYSRACPWHAYLPTSSSPTWPTITATPCPSRRLHR